jgi:signal transduction histidine kinase
MLDLQTLVFSLFIVEALIAILMVISGRIQKNYRGYDIWSLSMVVLVISTAIIIFRGVIPDNLATVGGNILSSLTLLLMAESLHRFYSGIPLRRGYYFILLPFAVLLTLFTQVIDIPAFRMLIASIFPMVIIMGIIRIIYKETPEHYHATHFLIVFFFFFDIILGIRAIDWFMNNFRNPLENTLLNIGFYLMGIITMITINFFYLILNFQRLAEDLRNEKETSEKLSTSLSILNNELDLKVRQRTQKIENLLLQKDQFINQIAHDLRTPLTPLVALVPLVRQGIADPDIQKLLEHLDKNVLYMRDMTEQIIKLATLNSQSSITDLHEVHLIELINDAISLNVIPIQERNISVNISIPSHLSIYVSKIYGTSIFSNIINNAVKYNSPSGKIDIIVTEDTTMISISITDTGIGMRADTLDRIWDELYICDSSRVDPFSKGLGLSMVRKIVSIHGGEITASSPGIGEGSVFTVRLPKICLMKESGVGLIGIGGK